MKKNNTKTTRNSYANTAVRITAVLGSMYGATYIVGGAVRDMLLSGGPNVGHSKHAKRANPNYIDIDIATVATPKEIKKTLKEMGLPIINLGEKFGTIAAQVDGKLIEITTFRSESGYSDGRHPDDVTFVTDVSTDARRRDLTINAMYFNPQTAELIDPIGGVSDIAAKRIRFVGDASTRIAEDPLRMLRAIRFETRLGFSLEPKAERAIRRHAALIRNIPAERLTAELDKIVSMPRYHQAVTRLLELGLLAQMLPEVTRLASVGQSPNYHAEGNVLIHTMRVFDHAADDWRLAHALDEIPDEHELAFRYTALFHDVGKWNTAKPERRDGRKHISFPHHAPVGAQLFLPIARRMKFSKERTKRIAYLIAHHMDLRYIADISKYEMLSFLAKPMLLDLIRLRYADDNGGIRTNAQGEVLPSDFSDLVRFRKMFMKMKRGYDLQLVDGEDVLKHLTKNPGVLVGKILTTIRDEQALRVIRTRREALKRISEIVGDKNVSRRRRKS